MNYFLALFLTFSAFYSNGQHTTDEINQVINQFFEGMLVGDSAMISAVLADDLVLQTTFENRARQVIVHKEDINEFLKAVGTPHDQQWNEKVSDIVIQIDGHLAHAWMNYEFYLGQEFSHCGVNSITFVNQNNSWKIVHLIDTRTTESCAGD